MKIVPIVLAAFCVDFIKLDAHIHLDQVLLARRYGHFWMHKRILCKHNPCYSDPCQWAHGVEDMRPRLPWERSDLMSLMKEQQTLTGGVFGGCVHVSCEVATIDETVALVSWGCDMLDGKIFAAFGIHPTHFDDYTPEVEALIERAIKKCGTKAVAWGETGLDYHHRRTIMEDCSMKMLPETKVQMCDVFAKQAQAAVRNNLPLVVHCREAEDDLLRVLSENVPSDHPVYMHSFDCSLQTLATFLAKWPQGVIGINGCVTWDGTHGGSDTGDQVAAILHNTPLSRILLETDGPYLAPEPHTGSSSHFGHIPWIAHSVAQILGLSTVAVLAATHDNFCRFHRLEKC